MRLTLSNPSVPVFSTINLPSEPATGSILDDDYHRLSVSHPSVNEGDAGTTANLRFKVTLDPPSHGTVTVDYATRDGDARAGGSANTGGDDYEAKSGTLTFEPGETTKTVTVIVNGDNAFETFRGDEGGRDLLFLTLFNPSGPGFSRIALSIAGRGTILDDDPRPTASFQALSYSVIEGENLVFPVTLGNSYYTFTVPFIYRVIRWDADGTTWIGGSASSSDFTIGDDPWPWSSSARVNFAPGQTEVPITLNATDDTEVEDDETVEMWLYPYRHDPYPVDDSMDTTIVTILDNDQPMVTAASDGDVTEGANADFTLTRTRNTSGELTVTFAVTGGDAVLSGSAPTSATIPADATTATVILATDDDNTDEPDVTLTLTLDDGAAYKLGGGSTATLTVQDNDGSSPVAPTATEKPGTVRHLSVSVGTGSLTISWEAPDAGGAASGYDVDYDLTGAAGGWVTALDNGEATSVTVTGLAPGKYRIRVRATNSHGSSKWVRDRVTVGG